jgi:hypothetical protein
MVTASKPPPPKKVKQDQIMPSYNLNPEDFDDFDFDDSDVDN